MGARHWLAQSPAAPLTRSEAGSVLAPRWRLRGLGKGVKFALKGDSLAMSLQKLPSAVITTAFPAGHCHSGREGTLAKLGLPPVPRLLAVHSKTRRAEGFIQLLLLETRELYQAEQCIWRSSPALEMGPPTAQREAKAKR